MMSSRISSVQEGEILSRYGDTGQKAFSQNAAAKNQGNLQERILQNPELLQEKVDKVQEMSDLMGHSLEFDVRKEANIVQIVVKDRSSGDVIKEIPPERIVKFLEGMQKLLGSLFDEKF
ncbi:MAG TPA: flagellar protein FlaG [Synergistaceae bacterium]|nr:flagellar protein FlaG [Synergistaceae bacterium]